MSWVEGVLICSVKLIYKVKRSMPELPEVETIKSQLHSVLPFTIEAVFFSPLTKRIVKQMDFELAGSRIVKIRRHAKWLIFELHPFGFMLSHLGMSGSWRMSDSPLQDKHGHIEFIDGSKSENRVLTYVDPRRFGHFYLLNEINFKIKENSFPIDVTSKEFDVDYIAELFFRFPNKVIKSFLLDQQAFPGVGNYMASEICARAGILPSRLTGEIEAHEIFKIKESLDLVIEGAIATKGTTFGGGYRDANGSKGEGIKHLVVFYQEHCQMCLALNRKTSVVKLIIGGRGTYYCPCCQK